VWLPITEITIFLRFDHGRLKLVKFDAFFVESQETVQAAGHRAVAVEE